MKLFSLMVAGILADQVSAKRLRLLSGGCNGQVKAAKTAPGCYGFSGVDSADLSELSTKATITFFDDNVCKGSGLGFVNLGPRPDPVCLGIPVGARSVQFD